MFSSPPAMLPGLGFSANGRTELLRIFAIPIDHAINGPSGSGVFARCARTCSAPQNSGTSVIRTVPCERTIESAARPSEGFAEMPENASEAPHFTPGPTLPLSRVRVAFIDGRKHVANRIKATLDCGLRAADLLHANSDQRLADRSLRASQVAFDHREVRLLTASSSRITPPTFGCAA
jgi:hypothetical protein